MRTCVVCGKALNKSELFRYVAIENKIYIDFFNKLQKRGFYTCKSRKCMDSLNKKRIKKALKSDADIDYDKAYILDTLYVNLNTALMNSIKLSNKSGLLVATQGNFIRAVKNNETFDIIFVANDISENSFKKFKNFLTNGNAKINLTFFDKISLGEIVNKRYVNIAGVLKSPFGKELIKQVEIIENIFEGAYSNGNGKNS